MVDIEKVANLNEKLKRELTASEYQALSCLMFKTLDNKYMREIPNGNMGNTRQNT